MVYLYSPGRYRENTETGRAGSRGAAVLFAVELLLVSNDKTVYIITDQVIFAENC